MVGPADLVHLHNNTRLTGDRERGITTEDVAIGEGGWSNTALIFPTMFEPDRRNYQLSGHRDNEIIPVSIHIKYHMYVPLKWIKHSYDVRLSRIVIRFPLMG